MRKAAVASSGSTLPSRDSTRERACPIGLRPRVPRLRWRSQIAVIEGSRAQVRGNAAHHGNGDIHLADGRLEAIGHVARCLQLTQARGPSPRNPALIRSTVVQLVVQLAGDARALFFAHLFDAFGERAQVARGIGAGDFSRATRLARLTGVDACRFLSYKGQRVTTSRPSLGPHNPEERGHPNLKVQLDGVAVHALSNHLAVILASWSWCSRIRRETIPATTISSKSGMPR